MGFTVTESPLRKTHPTAKNRVWGFFGETEEMHRAKPAAAPQPRRENLPVATKTASGVRFYGYRYYDPVTGRWPSRDPLWERGGMNLYGFIHNEPVHDIDYLGLAPVPGGPGHGNPDDAAKEGLEDAVNKQNSHKPRIEYCGWICCKDNIYKATEPQKGLTPEEMNKLPFPGDKSGEPGNMFDLGLMKGACDFRKIECPEGWKKVAPYHTHPEDSGFNFSDEKEGDDGYPSAYNAGGSDRDILKLDFEKLKELRGNKKSPGIGKKAAGERDQATSKIGEIPAPPVAK